LTSAVWDIGQTSGIRDQSGPLGGNILKTL